MGKRGKKIEPREEIDSRHARPTKKAKIGEFYKNRAEVSHIRVKEWGKESRGENTARGEIFRGEKQSYSPLFVNDPNDGASA